VIRPPLRLVSSRPHKSSAQADRRPVHGRGYPAVVRPRLPRFEPLALGRVAAPFDHTDWVFEVKYDGLRSLLYAQGGNGELVSRRGVTYRRFGGLARSIAYSLRCRSAVVDGELVSVDEQGRSGCEAVFGNREVPQFYAFDLLWLDGRDLRHLPMLERRALLRGIVPGSSPDIAVVQHDVEWGTRLFEFVTAHDLEGMVAKLAEAPYGLLNGRTPWVEIENPRYSRAADRLEHGEGARLRM
jgi:bifunctional non-homologous end joining protein LigD